MDVNDLKRLWVRRSIETSDPWEKVFTLSGMSLVAVFGGYFFVESFWLPSGDHSIYNKAMQEMKRDEKLMEALGGQLVPLMKKEFNKGTWHFLFPDKVNYIDDYGRKIKQLRFPIASSYVAEAQVLTESRLPSTYWGLLQAFWSQTIQWNYVIVQVGSDYYWVIDNRHQLSSQVDRETRAASQGGHGTGTVESWIQQNFRA